MTVTSLPFSSRTWRSSASANLRPSWKMWPISMPRADSRVPRRSSGQGSPSRTSAASIVPSGVKSRPGDQVEHVAAVDVGAGHPAGALDDPRVDEVADAGVALLAQRAGADVALDQRRGASRTRPRPNGSTSMGSSWPSSRFWSTSRSPGTPIASGSRVPSGCLRTTRTFFSVSAGRPGPVVAGELLVEVVDQGVDRRRVGRLLGVRGRARRRTATGLGRAAPRPPRRWRRSRSWCSGRRCPRRRRPWRGTPRTSSRPSRRWSP